ncbi:MAG: copper resistance protein NlpE [Ruminococcus sp.]|nr:copper resistance protein NlpE [Ruminococcus sp.]
MTKRNGLEFTTGVAALVLAVAAVVLFAFSYTTGYYTFGQMQSILITILLGAGILAEIVALFVRGKIPEVFWPKLLTFGVTALFAAASMLIIGDRVEGIGNCIVTDYDSGHGGEEAIYLSAAASILLLVAVVYNIIGSFARDKVAEKAFIKGKSTARVIGFGLSTVLVLLAVLIPTMNLVKGNGNGKEGGDTGNFVHTQSGGTYKVSFNANNGNAEDMPNYQFLCSDFKGLVAADSRFFTDVALTLDGQGGYTLFSEAYVVESDKRCEIGDDTGLGLVLTMNAEGTYMENEDGTYTTSVPTHAVMEMQSDTYSSQIKSAFGMNVAGNEEDGVYDSGDVPAVLDYVPETIWTMEGGAVKGWVKASETGGAASSADDGGVENPADASAQGDVTVTSDDGATTITFRADGTYRFVFDTYNVEDLGTYSYEGGTLTLTNSKDAVATAEGDPLKLHYVTAVSEQLTGDFTIPAADLQ